MLATRFAQLSLGGDRMSFHETPSVDGRIRSNRTKTIFTVVAWAVLVECISIGLSMGNGLAQQPASKTLPSQGGPSTPQSFPSGGSIPLGVPGTAQQLAPNPASNPIVPIYALPGNPALPNSESDDKQQPLPGPYTGPLLNPLLSPGPGMPQAAQPSAATQEKLAKYVARMLDPETTLDLVTHQTRVLILKGAPIRIQSGDASILAVNVVS